MTFDGLPTYDRLRLHKETCLLGHAAAVQCGAMERAQVYQRCLEEVERRLKELTRPIYPEAARPTFRTLVLARRAGHITAREFGLAAWWLRHART